ncbi:hypothetical protein [Nostoc sp. MG11]|uniref:hypothetical protein n=1 Tax=Nostoc sp. MG11 TaxID=2721166 RepID=UPI001865A787|nr:hypothetical protein [Nostoc sp. MG11]
MANVKISELQSAGYDLFRDSESFLDELATQEMQTIEGGKYFGSYGHSHSGGYKYSGGSSHSGGYNYSGGSSHNWSYFTF